MRATISIGDWLSVGKIFASLGATIDDAFFHYNTTKNRWEVYYRKDITKVIAYQDGGWIIV